MKPQRFEIINQRIRDAFLEKKALYPDQMRKRLKFSWSNWGFGLEDFAVSCARLEKAGIRFIELHGNHYGSDLGYHPEEIRTILADHGITCAGVCGMFSADNDLSSNRHDMIFEKPAKQWEQGVFMGNGLLGTVVWGGMDRPVKISLDRADIWDVRNATPDFEHGYNWKTFSECMEKKEYDRFFQTFMSGMQDHPRPSRFHIGRMELIPKGKMLSHTMRLRLADAVAEGTTVTDCGSIHWKTWVAATENLIIVEMESIGGERFTPKLKYIARDDYTEQDIKDSTRYAAHGDIFGRMSDRMKRWDFKPSEEGTTESGIIWWKQEIPENGSMPTAPQSFIERLPAIGAFSF